MCGRYQLATPRANIVDEFKTILSPDLDGYAVSGRYNIAPTQPVAVVVAQKDGGADGSRLLTAMRWGIIPRWMKPQPSGKPPAGWINARSETAATKPAFRGAYKYRRCLVPASGFYEWHKQDNGSKQPYLIRSADDGLMALAGLWETWRPPDGSELDTVTILTTSPNRMMAEIHDRMPVILEPEHWDAWTTAQPADTGPLTDLLKPADDGRLYRVAVSSRVNSPRHDDPACAAVLP
ncbi:MAG: SOS response-associated peptidase [Planctomycetota bacterium]